MKYFADFHVHSHYSRATSKNLNLESLYQWARIKGINVVGTGDFTHPGWITELEEKLEPEGNGLFRLKEPPEEEGLPGIKAKGLDVRFCLSTEISSIYKYGEKVRKNHNVVLAPDFEIAKKINARLSQIGNLASDGRPILGLPSRDLLEIVLETSKDAHLIPAHVWTPWFSTLGSKGGYDSIEECFRDLSEHIFALETGLSSDPAMNWKLSSLDRYALVSNSDAHSPQKLGREANIFNTEFSYYAMFEALKSRRGFCGTYEFFPQEGKYHLDGHRKCNISLTPQESMKLNNICPVCGKPLTIGVLNRVVTLADREVAKKPANALGFKYIVPLPEIIAQIKKTSSSSIAVMQNFTRLISTFGNEFDLLHVVPLEEIKSKSNGLLTEAIRRLREEEVHPRGGYDGEYGVISLFNPGEIARFTGQVDLFKEEMPIPDIPKKETVFIEKAIEAPGEKPTGMKPNTRQQQAIEEEKNTLVIAGPGTGKTNTLIQWIAYQIEQRDIQPEEVIAVTFTNKAADELKERLQKQIGEKAKQVLVGTFHAIAYAFLKKIHPELHSIYDSNNRIGLFRIFFPGMDKAERNKFSHAYEKYYEGMEPDKGAFLKYFDAYHQFLEENHVVDLSALIWEVNRYLQNAKDNITHRYKCLAVDEFQDINTVQYEFVRLLATGKHVFVIGDPNQSIYRFRGSDIRLFYKAEEDLQATRIVLQKNYRTPPNILNAAGELIRHNSSAGETQAEAVKTSPAEVIQYVAKNAFEEADYIANQVLNYVGGVDSLAIGQRLSDYDYAFSDIAVLYRTHRMGIEIINHLKSKGIPVLLSDGSSFLSEPPFNVLADALQLFQSRNNVVALSHLTDHLLNLTEIKKQVLLKNFMEGIVSFEGLSEDTRWKEWLQLYQQILPGFETCSPGHILPPLLDFFVPVSDSLTDDELIKREMLLKSASVSGKSIADFFSEFVLSPYTDMGRLTSGGVRLLTFHAAKGLEFPVVIIAGAEEGITPLNREDADMEEERRLFYVAMTRAKDELQIVRCKKRRMYGNEKEMKPSSFLNEFNLMYSKHVKQDVHKKNRKDEGQLKLF
ncbi:MAG: UvrD-helicase domain-containing protein [Mangrovibacterium sp.]